MHKIKKTIYVALITAFLFSCNDSNDDVVKEPSKNGSVETCISVSHANGYDVLTTTHIVWVNGNMSKKISTSDTIPFLGNTVETAETQSGEDTSVVIPKDYEIFITVK